MANKINLPLEDLIPTGSLSELEIRYLRNLKKHRLEYKRVKNLEHIYINRNRLKFLHEKNNSYIFRVRYAVMYKLGYFFEE